jgi:hypothetical protein
MSVLFLVPVWFILALLIPTAWSVSRVYSRSRGRRIVICPETNRAANIELDARHAVAMHVVGNPFQKVQECSRWPEHQSCSRECLAQVPRAA